MYAGGLIQRCFSDLVCQPLYGDILRHRRLSLFGHVALLDSRVPAHDALRLMVGIPTKAERQWPAGEYGRGVPATSSSTGFRTMPTLYCSYAVEIWDRQGPRSGATVHSDYATTTMMMKDDLCQKWRVKLIFQGTYRLSVTEIVECLKIIDVGCNLKQFDVEVDRRCIFHFRP